MGRASAIMVACLFLDELFLVLLCPLIFLFFSADDLFGASNCSRRALNYFLLPLILCSLVDSRSVRGPI
jgi:hypothetical protein